MCQSLWVDFGFSIKDVKIGKESVFKIYSVVCNYSTIHYIVMLYHVKALWS